MNANRITRYIVLASAVLLGFIVVLAVMVLVRPDLFTSEVRREGTQDSRSGIGATPTPTPTTTESEVGLSTGDTVEEIESDFERLELDDFVSDLDSLEREAQEL